MYYWWIRRRIGNTHSLIHKSVYWFNDRVPFFSGNILSSPISTLGNGFTHSFELPSSKHFLLYFCFSTSTKISFLLLQKRTSEGQLTKQVTKSSDKGKLRANDQINIFWIDEHEASTWHLSSNEMVEREQEKKLSYKINIAICNKKVNTAVSEA